MLFQVILIVFTVYAVLRWQKRDIYKLYNVLPKANVSNWPIIGQEHIMLRTMDDEGRMDLVQFSGREAIYHSIVAHWFVGHLYVSIADAEIADIILKTCLEKDDVMNVARRFTGNGLVYAPVSIWRPRRKILAPNFKLKNLMQFVKIFDEQSKIMVQQLKPTVGKGSFSVWKYVTTYTFDAVGETNLGTKTNSQLDPDNPCIHAFEYILKADIERMFKPWLEFKLINCILPLDKEYEKHKKFVYDFSDTAIKKKRKELQDRKYKNEVVDKSAMKPFLEMLIESSGGENGYSDQELREETVVITLAGTDTSAVGAAFILVVLSRFPDVQQKVYEEICEVFGDSNGEVVGEDLYRLKYMEAVIKETLRLYPPVPIITRKIDTYVKLPSGVTLLPNTSVYFNIWGIHRNHLYWGDDAESFKPERFLNGAPSHPAAYAPFSYGQRNCIGYTYAMLSMKTLCTNILRNYKILPSDLSISGKGEEPLRVKWNTMMKAVDGFMIQLEQRK